MAERWVMSCGNEETYRARAHVAQSQDRGTVPHHVSQVVQSLVSAAIIAL